MKLSLYLTKRSSELVLKLLETKRGVSFDFDPSRERQDATLCSQAANTTPLTDMQETKSQQTKLLFVSSSNLSAT